VNRYVFAKQHRRASGSYAWGVFDDVEKKFVEGGFFTKEAARTAAATWNAEDTSWAVKGKES